MRPSQRGDRRILLTGAAGFLGSHLCDALLARGDRVLAVDNGSTGNYGNLTHLREHPGFTFLEQDVSEPLAVDGPIDVVMHFASPASPRDYLALPVETLMVGSAGTHNLLKLAEAKGATFYLASTSEVYGDPLVSPQPETYFGNVNPVGPRSVYDEAKRFSEALTMAYRRHHGLDVRISRTFNVYGPRMRPDDGRVVAQFLVQALRGQPITVNGDGSQTRSFCYVEDHVRGLLALLDSDHQDPMNIGNPRESTMLELAQLAIAVTGSRSDLVFEPMPQDDPAQRCPDITVAREVLGWEPVVTLEDGLARSAAHYRSVLGL